MWLPTLLILIFYNNFTAARGPPAINVPISNNNDPPAPKNVIVPPPTQFPSIPSSVPSSRAQPNNWPSSPNTPNNPEGVNSNKEFAPMGEQRNWQDGSFDDNNQNEDFRNFERGWDSSGWDQPFHHHRHHHHWRPWAFGPPPPPPPPPMGWWP